MDFEAIPVAGRAAALKAAGLWRDALFCDDLDAAAAATPHAVAIVEHAAATGATRRITYAELRAHADRIAAGLAALGVRPGDVVGVQLPNSWLYAAIYLACTRIGAVINPLMPIFRERELEFMLGLAEARVLVLPHTLRGYDHAALGERLRARLPSLRHVFVVGGDDPGTAFEHQLLEHAWEREVDCAALFAQRRPSADAVTEIMYTSGTTGEPKGVMHTANTLGCKAKLASELFGFGARDVIFMGSPVAHQTGFMYGICLALYHGATCVLLDQWDPVAAARLIAAERCTITLASTPFLSDLVHTEAAHAHDTSCLRLFLCAGAPIPSALVAAARRTHPALYVMSAWGMTEMGITTATYPGDPDAKVLDTDGRALPHQAVRVVDEADRPLPPGTEGRLQARCVTTFVGYLRRPAAYCVDEGGWIDTGDNARMDEDGYIRITGRSKDIIIRGGENIPVVEIEQLLYRHPAIEDAALVAMPDARLGERACAYATLRAGATLDFAGMVAFLADAGLIKQYLPERLEVIDAFPRTPSGKIQKFVLREWARALAPQRG